MKKAIVIATLLLATGVSAYYILPTFTISDLKVSMKMDKKESKTRPKEELMSYETEADSPDQCSSYENYDEEAGVCYFECSSKQECTEIQNSIDDELSGWVDQGEQDTTPLNETGGDDIKTLASYKVSSGEKITLESGTDKPEYENIWNEIASLSPNNISDKYIETYQVYDDPKSDSLAFVDDADQNGKWRIVINLAGRRESDLREQKATLIHELGHIITLNLSQVNPNVSTCNNYKLDEGCANKESIVNTFYNTYWNGIKVPATYSANKFVTEYASSEPVEDLAETFAFFVIEKDKNNLGNDIKDQKIKMMYNYPDLVQIRNDMRNVLGREIVRARKLHTS